MRRVAASFLVLLTVATPALGNAAGWGPIPTDDYPDLTADLEKVRVALGIPGMAAAVVKDGHLVWAAGFGFADIEREIEADPHTPFGLASVTKPVAATLVMQLVEDGLIDLDEPVASYGVDIADDAGITVRHLLTHTSEGVPGTSHNYNGNRYGLLGGVIEGAMGRSFADLLGEKVLLPVGMADTALNPMNAWADGSAPGFEELRRSLGWGDPFGNYPDVYARLAKPYQFGDDYQAVPGMYHLTHSPAAGLNSSVTDLAAFDIALDQGLLLGESARQEMWAAAVPTVTTRSDLNYGLGWYVQDYDGTELLWHTGRWPPSTSALYLKLPSANVTFIVLANTDNLTVPFPDIGIGDIRHSTPALTFFRHFLFPSRHGYELPIVDWGGTHDEIVDQLTTSTDPVALAFLEEELWSYRQAYASSGDTDQAAVLMAANKTVFPGSSMRRDPSFTTTAGRYPYVAPVLSARSMVAISRGVVVWLIAVVGSLAWMAVRLLRSKSVWIREGLLWLIATALVGPVGPLLHRRRAHLADAPEDAVCLSLFCIAAYGVAWVIALLILVRLDENANPLVILGATLLIPFIVGLVLVRGPTLLKAGIRPYRQAVRSGVVAEAITAILAFAVFFPLMMYFDSRLLSAIPHPTSPYFGAMMSMMAVVGIAVLTPLQSYMLRRGFGGAATTSAGASSADPAVVMTATMRNSWRLLLAVIAIMIMSLALSISVFG